MKSISLEYFLSGSQGIASWNIKWTYMIEFYVWVSVHHKLIYIKRTNVMQLGSMFISNCNIALHVSDIFCVHLQENLETVEAASDE